MVLKRFVFQIPILLLLLAGCKGKTKNDDHRNIADTDKILSEEKNISRIVHLMAKPDSVNIDISKAALIVVDMENDFGAKGGMFDQAGIDISDIQKVVDPAAKVLLAARQAGIKIIYLKMGYHPDLSDLGEEGAYYRENSIHFMHVGDTITAPDGSKSRIQIRDNWGTDILSELKPEVNDIIIYKTRYSGFYQTNLDSTIKALGKKYLIFVGCTTSVCVESTVRDAAFRDYLPIVLEDCTAEPIGSNFPRSNKEASLLVIQEGPFGLVTNSNEFIKAIKKQVYTNTKLE